MEGSGTKDVFTIDYMKAIRFSLNTIAQWPNKEFGNDSRMSRILSIYRYILITMSFLVACNCILYLCKNKETLDFLNFGHVYGNIMMSAFLIQRATLSFQKRYCSLIKKFASEFHLMHHKHKSDFAEKEYQRIDKLCKIVALVFHIQLIVALILYMMTPFYNNVRAGMFSENQPANKTFEHSVYYELPFDYTTDVTGYYIVFFFNWYPCFNVSASAGAIDLLIFFIVFHVMGHFNILAHNLKCFPRICHGSEEQMEEEFIREYNDQIFILLKDTITHYQYIKEFISETSTAFDLTLCVYLAFIQLNGVVFLLECSSLTAEALLKYGFLTMFVFQQLLQTSAIFEQINSKSEKLADKVYGLPWESMDTRNRRIVLVFLRNVQNTIALKACGVVPLGVLTMSAILRTTTSYFVMLNTFTK